MSSKAIQISVRVTSEQRDRWEYFAQKDHRSLADWVRLQVEAACERLEEAEKRDG